MGKMSLTGCVNCRCGNGCKQGNTFYLDSIFRPVNERLIAKPEWRPARQTEFADAFDIRFVADRDNGLFTLQPNEKRFFGLGVALDLPSDLSAELRPRSSLGYKRGLFLINADTLILSNKRGLIESDYKDELKAHLWNITNNPVTLFDGERICQVRFSESMTGFCNRSHGKYKLKSVATQRVGGYGSTGVS